ncbi:hypothetical protein CEXT_450711 [Caerostris extrusa]|uniref:Uncharacterized protein n=1 Tax=Caerostris extrusa TaxID=172846 RepID=A0AAV4T049_CAEEX|nr:hypothetical protein CEXT_450711 [Caerostris extrusa]
MDGLVFRHSTLFRQESLWNLHSEKKSLLPTQRDLLSVRKSKKKDSVSLHKNNTHDDYQIDNMKHFLFSVTVFHHYFLQQFGTVYAIYQQVLDLYISFPEKEHLYSTVFMPFFIARSNCGRSVSVRSCFLTRRTLLGPLMYGGGDGLLIYVSEVCGVFWERWSVICSKN